MTKKKKKTKKDTSKPALGKAHKTPHIKQSQEPAAAQEKSSDELLAEKAASADVFQYLPSRYKSKTGFLVHDGIHNLWRLAPYLCARIKAYRLHHLDDEAEALLSDFRTKTIKLKHRIKDSHKRHKNVDPQLRSTFSNKARKWVDDLSRWFRAHTINDTDPDLLEWEDLQDRAYSLTCEYLELFDMNYFKSSDRSPASDPQEVGEKGAGDIKEMLANIIQDIEELKKIKQLPEGLQSEGPIKLRDFIEIACGIKSKAQLGGVCHKISKLQSRPKHFGNWEKGQAKKYDRLTLYNWWKQNKDKHDLPGFVIPKSDTTP